MSDIAQASFDRFLDLAQQKLRGVSPTTARGGLRLVQGASAPLGERVAALEGTEEFRALGAEMEVLFRGQGFGSHHWSHSVGNWFRRSRLYHNLGAGEALPASSTLFDRLCQELHRSESQVTYFALVEHVYFGAERLDFGRYEIVRFAQEELDTLMETDVCATFYPWASAPTAVLSQYWWIVVRERVATAPIWPKGRVLLPDVGAPDVVPRSYTDLPHPVERVLQELALFDWRPDWAGDEPRWAPFGIPICLRANDHLTASPRGPRADIAVLDRHPDFDPSTGEEFERPHILFHLNKTAAEGFREFISREGVRLHRARETPWSRPLIEVASRFLAKAFFSDGLEQPLWHITAIESLAGQRAGRVVNSLAQRLSTALGAGEADRNRIKETFTGLYDLRCELVHGRAPQGVVLSQHLFEARELARGLLRWFVRLICDVQEQLEAANSELTPPRRKDFLRLLDHEPAEYPRGRSRWLPPGLPNSFPRYPDVSFRRSDMGREWPSGR